MTEEELLQLIPEQNWGIINYDAKQIRKKLGKKTKADIYETSGMVLQKV